MNLVTPITTSPEASYNTNTPMEISTIDTQDTQRNKVIVALTGARNSLSSLPHELVSIIHTYANTLKYVIDELVAMPNETIIKLLGGTITAIELSEGLPLNPDKYQTIWDTFSKDIKPSDIGLTSSRTVVDGTKPIEQTNKPFLKVDDLKPIPNPSKKVMLLLHERPIVYAPLSPDELGIINSRVQVSIHKWRKGTFVNDVTEINGALKNFTKMAADPKIETELKRQYLSTAGGAMPLYQEVSVIMYEVLLRSKYKKYLGDHKDQSIDTQEKLKELFMLAMKIHAFPYASELSNQIQAVDPRFFGSLIKLEIRSLTSNKTIRTPTIKIVEEKSSK